MISYRGLLEAVQNGALSVDDALGQLKRLDTEDLGFAQLDHHRALRQGLAEVVYGEGKAVDETVAILQRLYERDSDVVLATRVNPAVYEAVRHSMAEAVYHKRARLLTVIRRRRKPVGKIVIACAGTSDLPVAEEALYTADALGNSVELIADIGVAGIHRVFAHLERLWSARVVIVVAGMEGALPSVIAGMVDRPIVAVPTSVGYGAAFGGLAALLGMLNSCAAGVSVVNIDNGFGAANVASKINQLETTSMESASD